MISIVVPSRNRPDNLTRLVKSLKDTSSNFDNLDIILRLDDDDKDLAEYKKRLDGYKNINILVDGKRENLSDLWDECYYATKHPLVMMCADDVVFRTKNWDKILNNRMPNPDKTLYLAWCDDKNQGPLIPTLPIMSKAWIDSIGYFVPRDYVCDFCDVHIHEIARRLQKFNIEVMLYNKDIIIEHMHPTVAKGKWDAVYTSRRDKRSKAAIIFKRKAKERKATSEKLRDLVKSGKLDSINIKAK